MVIFYRISCERFSMLVCIIKKLDEEISNFHLADLKLCKSALGKIMQNDGMVLTLLRNSVTEPVERVPFMGLGAQWCGT